MNQIRQGELEHHILSAKISFIDTGETRLLKTRLGSACHFFDIFTVGDNNIQLRLDWTCLEKYGHPMLDADFLNKKTGKHRSLKGKRKEAHNTAPSQGNGRYFEWLFDGCSKKFIVTVAWINSVADTVSLGDSCSAEIISAVDRSKNG